jgi:hypothetical protein
MARHSTPCRSPIVQAPKHQTLPTQDRVYIDSILFSTHLEAGVPLGEGVVLEVVFANEPLQGRHVNHAERVPTKNLGADDSGQGPGGEGEAVVAAGYVHVRTHASGGSGGGACLVGVSGYTVSVGGPLGQLSRTKGVERGGRRSSHQVHAHAHTHCSHRGFPLYV